jgi:hypothetical protein
MYGKSRIWLLLAAAAVAGWSISAEAQQYQTDSVLGGQKVLTSHLNEDWNATSSDCCEAGCASGDCESCGGCGGCESCGECGGCGSCCAGALGGLFDNVLVFAGGDGWKNHGDDDDNNNFGYRLGFNSGLGGSRIRFQFGASYGFYDFYGRENEPQDNAGEGQLFLTGGVYKRSDVCGGDNFSWGLVYDYMNSQNWGEEAIEIELGQIRCQIGYALSAYNEMGVWAAIGVDDALTRNLINAAIVAPKDQVNVYWLHNFEFGGETMVYIGLADEPNGANQVFQVPDLTELVFGVRGRAPLNDRIALYGNAHYIVPGTSQGDTAPNGINNSYAEEVWNVSFGLIFYPGSKARACTVSGQAGLPLIGVADNGTFAVNTPTGNL